MRLRREARPRLLGCSKTTMAITMELLLLLLLLLSEWVLSSSSTRWLAPISMGGAVKSGRGSRPRSASA